MGGLIGWIIVGIAASWLAGVITRTNRSIWGDLVPGLVGALVAGLFTDSVDGDSNTFVSIVVAALFAAALVLIKNFIMDRRA